MSSYCKLVKGTVFASEEYGTLENGTWFSTMGYFDTETGTVYIKSGLMIGGMNMSKYDRNRKMFFGSWTGEDISESAKANIGDSTGVTGCTVLATTFGAAIGGLSGEYVFQYDEDKWKINGEEVSNLNTKYGLTITGDPKNGDILVVVYTASASGWEALGKDNDDLSKELNPDVERFKNVLGESNATHSGYEPEISVDPYYIDPSRKMYAHLREIATQELFGDSDILGWFAEAEFETKNSATRVMTGYCYVRRAYYVPQSVGGDTAGYAIPVNIIPTGGMVKKKIVYDMNTNEAKITEIE